MTWILTGQLGRQQLEGRFIAMKLLPPSNERALHVGKTDLEFERVVFLFRNILFATRIRPINNAMSYHPRIMLSKTNK